MISAQHVTGVILAGGRGQRLGGADKGLHHYQGRPLIEHALAALQPQVATLMISANRNIEHYARYGFPVVSDPWPDFRGPLAGIVAALQQAPTDYILTIPCDNPQLPANLVQHMLSALHASASEVCVLELQQRLEPAYVLVPKHYQQHLMDYLDSGQRAIHGWLAQLGPARACYTENSSRYFINLNTPEELG